MKNRLFTLLVGATLLLSGKVFAQTPPADFCSGTLYGNIEVNSAYRQESNGRIIIDNVDFITCTDGCNRNLSDKEQLFKFIFSLYAVHNETGGVYMTDINIGVEVEVTETATQDLLDAQYIPVQSWKDGSTWYAGVGSNYWDESIISQSTVDVAEAYYDAITQAHYFKMVLPGVSFPKTEILDAVRTAQTKINDCEDAKNTTKKELNKLIGSVDLDQYTGQTKTDLDVVLQAADGVAVKPDATLDELEDAITALNDAKYKADKEKASGELKELMALLEQYDLEQYTDQTKTALEEAIKEAKRVAADPNATPDELNDAIAKLKDAKKTADEEKETNSQTDPETDSSSEGVSLGSLIKQFLAPDLSFEGKIEKSKEIVEFVKEEEVEESKFKYIMSEKLFDALTGINEPFWIGTTEIDFFDKMRLGEELKKIIELSFTELKPQNEDGIEDFSDEIENDFSREVGKKFSYNKYDKDRTSDEYKTLILARKLFGEIYPSSSTSIRKGKFPTRSGIKLTEKEEKAFLQEKGIDGIYKKKKQEMSKRTKPVER